MSRLLLNRRRFALLGLSAVAAGTAWAYHHRGQFEGDTMTPQAAHKAQKAGNILLIDIRRPEEWAQGGIAEGAVPLDMRRDDFMSQLLMLTGGDTKTPIALICAAGVRSDRMSASLTQAGFSRIIDVPEGMYGSHAGPGWLKRGLPVERVQ